MKTLKKSNRYLLIAVLIAAGLLQTGCIGVSNEFRNTRRYIVSQLDVRYFQVFEFSIGRSLMSVASLFVKMSDNKEKVDELLDQINRVQISNYEKRDHRSYIPSSEEMQNLVNKIKELDYDYFVKVRERDNMTLVFLKNSEIQFYDKMLMVIFEEENFVIVELDGNLERMVDFMLKKANKELTNKG